MKVSTTNSISLTCTTAHVEGDSLCCCVDVEAVQSTSDETEKSQNAADFAPIDLFLCVDVSGSMGNVIGDLVRTVQIAARALRPEDRLCVVKFESVASLVFGLSAIGDLSDFDSVMQREIVSCGGTDIGVGVELCLKELVKRDDVAGRFSSLIVLSDGATGGRDRVGIVNLVRQTLLESERSLVVHSLGFTSSCDVPLMQGVAADAGDTPGLFYYLRDANPDDMRAAVGDCLGVTQTIALTNLQIEILPTRSAFDSDDPTHTFGFVMDGVPTSARRAKLGAMCLSQRHTFVLALAHQGDGVGVPDELKLRVSYSVPSARHVVDHDFVLPCTVPLDPILKQASELHCVTHQFRSKAAALLHRLCMPQEQGGEDRAEVLEKLADLHEAIIQQINLMRVSELVVANHASTSDSKQKKTKKKTDDDASNASSSSSAPAAAALSEIAAAMALRDEAVLEALSIDLGQVLVEMSDRGRHSARASGGALRAYHEHAFQQSSHNSSGSLRAGPYTTPHQLESRLRFMEADESCAAAKLALPVESVELWGDSAEALELRRAVDENVACFVSLETWREASLGLGLIVEPRTGRERRRGLLPRALLSGDIISAATYNQGVRALVQAVAPQQLDRDDVDNADKHQVLPSSCRGRINAWLPLYINAENWKSVKRFAQASVSIIGTQFNDQFTPELCLGVLSKLLIQCVVRFTLGEVSERTLQQFCDVHRVFLQLAEEFPAVTELAASRLQAFIDSPLARTRAYTSDLGDLIFYLVVDFSHQWRGALAEKWLIESVRRAAYQMGDAAKQLHRLSGDIDGLLRFWAENTTGGKVSTFCGVFLDLVARPPGIDDASAIKRDIDSRWGHVRASTLANLRRVCAELQAGQRSVPEIMSGLLGRPVTPGAAAELIVWGFSEARADEERRTPKYIDMPVAEGAFVERWRAHAAIWNAALATPAPDLAAVVDEPANPRKRTLGGVCRSLRREFAKARPLPPPGAVGSMSIRSGDIVQVACDCDRCAFQVFLAERRTAWNGASKAQDSDENVMFIGGLSAATFDVSALHDMLVAYGGDGATQLREIEVVRDTVSGKAKPYVFVRFASRQAVLDTMRSIRAAHKEGRVGARPLFARPSRNSTVRDPFPALWDEQRDETNANSNFARFWFNDKPIVFDVVRHVEPRWLQH